jgi:sigma-B regulation protein RsbU (phosphoserine phosphatase)
MRIAIGSEPRLLSILRSVVRFRAQEAGFADNQAERLAMAIDEAAANIIRHTYGGRPDDRLALEVREYRDRLEFILEDWGPKVCENLIHPRSLEDLRPGGLGTLIIASFVDESSYDPEFKNGNRLKLVKYLSRKVPPCDEGSCSQSG